MDYLCYGHFAACFIELCFAFLVFETGDQFGR